jgi:hypothetical protein
MCGAISPFPMFLHGVKRYSCIFTLPQNWNTERSYSEVLTPFSNPFPVTSYYQSLSWWLLGYHLQIGHGHLLQNAYLLRIHFRLKNSFKATGFYSRGGVTKHIINYLINQSESGLYLHQSRNLSAVWALNFYCLDDIVTYLHLIYLWLYWKHKGDESPQDKKKLCFGEWICLHLHVEKGTYSGGPFKNT